ncbi:MAG: hypothetical protein MZV70_66115 [Desulfobacterales bacterium]|nr:hypothetical protein [Desulfobacterales bacterium]
MTPSRLAPPEGYCWAGEEREGRGAIARSCTEHGHPPALGDFPLRQRSPTTSTAESPIASPSATDPFAEQRIQQVLREAGLGAVRRRSGTGSGGISCSCRHPSIRAAGCCLGVDYSNFLPRYDADRNDKLNRDDYFLAAYVFYRLWPRTALFAQYTATDIRYTDNATTNSKEHGLLGGFDWDMTAKTDGDRQGRMGKEGFSRISRREQFHL